MHPIFFRGSKYCTKLLEWITCFVCIVSACYMEVDSWPRGAFVVALTSCGTSLVISTVFIVSHATRNVHEFTEAVFDVLCITILAIGICVSVKQRSANKLDELFIGLLALNVLFFLSDLVVYRIVYDPVLCCWIAVRPLVKTDDDQNERNDD
ncbi:uncharacterized protein LOC124175790 [Neodiprion fabricii]|uniref:uncharacterized protein LOC124175790 n=1 Tax=Neodiprion fabricii TaxID=2872261 RepID=UPI001ED8E1B3|nr:uncharacterized protein LOC124175790 [Neodiprion fabricii]